MGSIHFFPTRTLSHAAVPRFGNQWFDSSTWLTTGRTHHMCERAKIALHNPQRFKLVCPGLSKFKIGASHHPSSAAPLPLAGVSSSLARIS